MPEWSQSQDATDSHGAMMQRCLNLAQKAAGQTAPNPMVGAVVVKAGKIVGEGYHPGAGAPHAEVFALQAAGDMAAEATLYVNLEPCNHTGRTPPCTEAILRAGIQKVVIGMTDPNPVASGGVDRLRAAGVDVITGVEERACQKLNEAFTHRVNHHQPFGIFKYAMTLDGKIATQTGHSQWITSPQSRTAVHRLRGSCDAVLVGGNTVRRDNPRLTTHGLYEHNPLRIVMSRELNLPHPAHLWDTNVAPTLVFTEEPGPGSSVLDHSSRRQQIESQGVEVISLSELTPKTISPILYERGLSTVLWECGGTLASAALKSGSIQKIWAFIAPKLIGGLQAPTPTADLGILTMDEALCLKHPELVQLGPDWLIKAYL